MSVDEFGNEIEDEEEPNEAIKALRKQAKDGKAAQAEAARLARENAFLRAGIPETPATSYFVKGYDGDPDPEAIRAAAVEAGFLQPEKTEPEVSPDEVAAQERLQAAAAGGGSVTPPGYDEELAAAGSKEAALAVMKKYQIAVVD